MLVQSIMTRKTLHNEVVYTQRDALVFQHDEPVWGGRMDLTGGPSNIANGAVT